MPQSSPATVKELLIFAKVSLTSDLLYFYRKKKTKLKPKKKKKNNLIFNMHGDNNPSTNGNNIGNNQSWLSQSSSSLMLKLLVIKSRFKLHKIIGCSVFLPSTAIYVGGLSEIGYVWEIINNHYDHDAQHFCLSALKLKPFHPTQVDLSKIDKHISRGSRVGAVVRTLTILSLWPGFKCNLDALCGSRCGRSKTQVTGQVTGQVRSSQ